VGGSNPHTKYYAKEQQQETFTTVKLDLTDNKRASSKMMMILAVQCGLLTEGS
jgi:hypothetical protein